MAAAPPAPALTEALNHFADTLFATQENLSQGQYLDLSNAAKRLFDAKRSSASGSASSHLAAAREQLSSHIDEMHVELDSCRSQIIEATVTIDSMHAKHDSLRALLDQYSRRLAVVESLASRLGATTRMLDTEFELYNLQPQATFNENRKRRRLEASLAGEEAEVSGDEDGGSEGDEGESDEEDEILFVAPLE